MSETGKGGGGVVVHACIRCWHVPHANIGKYASCLCETRVGMTSLSSQTRGGVRQIARGTGGNKITLSTSPLSTPSAPHISNGGDIRDRILAYRPSAQPLNLYAVLPQYPSLTDTRSLSKYVSLSLLSLTLSL